MAENAEKHMDMLLRQLADEVADKTPRPGPDLVARVLAQAGEVAAATPRPVEAPVKTIPAARPGLFDMLLGWTTGAVAAMAVALALGIGVGMELEPGNLPFMDAEEDQLTMADGGFLPEDIL